MERQPGISVDENLTPETVQEGDNDSANTNTSEAIQPYNYLMKSDCKYESVSANSQVRSDLLGQAEMRADEVINCEKTNEMNIFEEILKAEIDEMLPKTCEICYEPLADEYHMKVHMLLHTKHTPFECKFCSEKFTREYLLRRHARNTHYHPCHICTRFFNVKSELDAHLSVHEKRKETLQLREERRREKDFKEMSQQDKQIYKCLTCNETFFSHLSYTYHIYGHSFAGCENCKLKVEKCKIRVVTQCLMDGHMNKRPYECDQCNKRFLRKGSLKRHKVLYCPAKK